MPSLIEDQDLYKNINKHLNAATYSLVDCGNKHLCIELGSIDTYKLEELYKKLQPEITTKKLTCLSIKKLKGKSILELMKMGLAKRFLVALHLPLLHSLSFIKKIKQQYFQQVESCNSHNTKTN